MQLFLNNLTTPIEVEHVGYNHLQENSNPPQISFELVQNDNTQSTIDFLISISSEPITSVVVIGTNDTVLYDLSNSFTMLALNDNAQESKREVILVLRRDD